MISLKKRVVVYPVLATFTVSDTEESSLSQPSKDSFKHFWYLILLI